jgi:hypothetical protein
MANRNWKRTARVVSGPAGGRVGQRAGAGRRGSTLIIVIGMLGLLLLLGLTFFTFSAQENQSAENYSEGNKRPRELDPSLVLDFGLKQVIVGADEDAPGSALAGPLYRSRRSADRLQPAPRHSLVATMMGFDSSPFNGEGVNVSVTDVGVGALPPDGIADTVAFGVDRDRNGVLDRNQTPAPTTPDQLLRLNWSSRTNNGNVRILSDPRYVPTDLVPSGAGELGTFPQSGEPYGPPAPDVDYTAADINNPFLAYIGTTIHPTSGAVLPVVIPSFHRPQYLRNTNTGVPLNNSTPDDGTALGWARDPATADRVLRPHPSHIVRGSTGVTRFRYIRPVVPTVNVADAVFNSLNQRVGPFPFLVDRDGDGDFNEQGVFSGTNLTDAVARASDLEYDVDNDGDGLYEGVWLDIDFPAQQITDGRFYVPMFSFTILDGDGLMNLNEVGNLFASSSNARDVSKTELLNANRSISRSNHGVSRSEINPTYGFDLDPSEGVPAAEGQQYRAQYHLPSTGSNPGVDHWPTLNRRQLANLELANLLWGRMRFAAGGGSYNVAGVDDFTLGGIGDLTAGRWGDLNLLLSAITDPTQGVTVNALGFLHAGALFPVPGQPGVDDNGNLLQGGAFASTTTTTSTQDYFLPLFTGFYPAFYHPTDFRGWGGVGESLFAGRLYPGTQGAPNIYSGSGYAPGSVTLGPNRFQRYAHVRGGSGYGTSAPYGTSLVATSNTSQNQDEPAETVTEPTLAGSNDQIFGVEEMAGLHLTATDFPKAGTSSRLRQLASINFEQGGSANVSTQAARLRGIRSRYTTSSWDRKQFGLGVSQYHVARQTTSPTAGDLAVAGTAYQNSRGWETEQLNQMGTGSTSTYNPATRNQRAEFPPWCGGSAIGARLQPVRTAVRELFSVQPGYFRDNELFQRKLNINRVLLDPRHANLVSPYFTGTRLLTPHPGDPGVAAIPGVADVLGTDNQPGVSGTDDDGNGLIDNDGAGGFDLNELGALGSDDLQPATSAAIQEFWARRDRQVLARDIYVLLYLMGGGRNDVNYATTSNAGRGLYSEQQLAEMAQFAVNYVDALDPDDVITMFEYDKDLEDGWDLDDNPFGTISGFAENDRGTVFGVERQALAINEVLAVSFEGGAGSQDHMTFDETPMSQRYYLQVELANVGPTPVSVSGNVWRLERVTARPTTATVPNGIVQRRLTINDTTQNVAAGGVYTIAARTGNDTAPPGSSHPERPSDFRAKIGGMVTQIAPSTPTVAAFSPGDPDPGPSASLDLVWGGHLGRAAITDGGGAVATSYLDDLLNLGADVRLVLSRRLHPGRAASSPEADNPWVVVDYFDQRPFRRFDLTAADVNLELRNTASRSYERRQPLERRGNGDYSTLSAVMELEHLDSTGTSIVRNTIGNVANSRTVTEYTDVPGSAVFSVRQPQFDRDFTSPLELLSLPLYGPDRVTEFLALGQNFARSRDTDFGESFGREYTAARKVLRPDFNPANTTNPEQDNRWYRIFSLLEVPEMENAHPGIAGYTSVERNGRSTSVPRAPGKINLNTIRDVKVLAGLLDDLSMNCEDSLLVDAITDLDTGSAVEGGRQWWPQFLKARDQQDRTTGLYLPGMPGSRPFRSAFDLGRNVNWPASGLESSIFRSLPFEGSLATAFYPNLDLDGASEPRPDRRTLFEARTAVDTNLADYQQMDLQSRYRLLTKVANHTTTRSNVFYGWMTVGYFEAVYDQTARVYRVGAELPEASTGLKRTRAFFTLDRSDIERHYDPVKQTLDYRKFIKQQVRLD